ncbi:MAG: hypothetical protein ABIO92_07720 [Chloroflexia bacterium]
MVPPSLAHSAHSAGHSTLAPITWSNPGDAYLHCPSPCHKWLFDELSALGSRLRSDFQRTFGAGFTSPGLSAPCGTPTLSVTAFVFMFHQI